MPCTGGNRASNPAQAISSRPNAWPRAPTRPLPRPLSVCASGSRCAASAGSHPPAACSGCTEQSVDHSRGAVPLQIRGHAGEIATAQVAAQHLQTQVRQAGAQRDSRDAADRAEQQRLGQNQALSLPGRQSQHAQQCELLRPPRDAQREHRIHEEGAGEESHQGQHGEVDAVGARQVVDTLRGVGRFCRDHAGRQLQRAHEGCVVRARAQTHVDARELALAAEEILGRANVHHREWAAGGRHGAGHRGVAQLEAALQTQCLLPCWRCQRLPCRGIEKNRVRCKNSEAVGTLTRHRHQRRRDGSHRQRVDPDDPHRLALAAARLRQGADFQDRAGNGDLRVAGHPGVKALVERALDGAQFQVGLSRRRADRAGELAQRGGIDQVNRKRQRHAQRHGKHSSCVAPGMVAQFLPGEGAKQREHGLLCSRSLRLARRPRGKVSPGRLRALDRRSVLRTDSPGFA